MSQNVAEATAQLLSDLICAAVKLTEKKLLEVEGGGHVLQCPIAGDANAH